MYVKRLENQLSEAEANIQMLRDRIAQKEIKNSKRIAEIICDYERQVFERHELDSIIRKSHESTKARYAAILETSTKRLKRYI